MDEYEIDRSYEINELLESDDPSDVARGIVLVKEGVLNGDPYAQYTTAKWHRTGFAGYRVDAAREAELLWMAAENLVPDAVFDIAVSLQDSEKSLARRKSFGFYVVAAIMGDVDAMNAILRAFRYGIGAARNPDAERILEKYIVDVVDTSSR